jgi:hypothetical protein
MVVYEFVQGGELITEGLHTPVGQRVQALLDVLNRYNASPPFVVGAMRRQVSYRDTIAGYDEGLTLLHPAHDRSAVVAELALTDYRAHLDDCSTDVLRPRFGWALSIIRDLLATANRHHCETIPS